MEGEGLAILVGPLERDPLDAGVPHPERLELERLLAALVADAESTTRDDGCWLRLDVRIPQAADRLDEAAENPRRVPRAGSRCGRGMRVSLSPNQLEENELLRAYHERGDASARDKLVEANLPLARAIARRYAGRGEQLDDLVQVASIGLIKAIDRFDLERGVFFRTYAVPTIVGEIKRHFRDRAWAVHVPRRLKELTHVLRAKAISALRSRALAHDRGAGRGRGRRGGRSGGGARVEPRLHGAIADRACRGGLRARPDADPGHRRGGLRRERGSARDRHRSPGNARAQDHPAPLLRRADADRRSRTSSGSRRCMSHA